MYLTDRFLELADADRLLPNIQNLEISTFNGEFGAQNSLGGVDVFDILVNTPHNSDAEFDDYSCCACAGCGQDAIKNMIPTDTFETTFIEGGSSDTIAGNSSTTASIQIGGTAEGVRNSASDSDWFAVDLEAGVSYTFYMIRDEVDGVNPHEDPLLRLIDSNGTTELATNDDIGPGLRNSKITFTATSTDTYYLSAEGWNTTTGGYTLFAEEGSDRPDFTLDEIAYFLTHQFSNYSYWNQTTITYNVQGLTAEGRDLAVLAFDAWEEVTGLTFTRVTNGGEIVFDDNQNGAFASTNAPSSGGVITSATINVDDGWTSSYDVNDYRYQTYLHEIGHALGLGHGGAYNGSATHGVDNLYNQDAWNYTVMSYFDQNEAGTGTARLVLGLQMADILAAQNVYGIATNTRNGDSIYGFNTTETGSIYDFQEWQNQGVRTPSFAVFDSGGIDTFDFSGYISDQTISLVSESFSSIGDNTNTASTDDALENVISIARDVVIENAIGGSGDDTITGNTANNELTGNGGDDTIYGGDGTDYAIFSGNRASYTITDNNDGTFTVSGTDGTDTLTNVEFARFDDQDVDLAASGPVNLTNNNDTYDATSGDDEIYGLDGDDFIRGLEGDDYLDGGNGNDTLLGGLGADQLIGGADIDTASYAEATERVWVDLVGTIENRGEALGDTYDSIENLTGSVWSDQLRGDAGENELNGGARSDRVYGRAGDDTLNGEGGADAIYGNRGADIMTGGADTVRDRFIYFQLNDSGVGSGNRDIITDFTSGEDRIEISRFDANSVGGGGNDVFVFIADAAFSNSAGELRYEKAGGITLIQADVDGDGAADFEIELTGEMDLLATDFLL